ncbi:MAG: hypothetical protein CK538_03020 [Opitutia bacterium]|nr:MAG: hypothetical protein CK538_03020 [Opitutae bacterium]
MLILGGAGSVGSAAVQIASHLGAVVSTTSSAANLELLRRLGAAVPLRLPQAGIRPRRCPLRRHHENRRANTFGEAYHALRPSGLYLAIAADLSGMLAGFRLGPKGRLQFGGLAPARPADVAWLVDLAARRHHRAVIDRTLPLAQIAAAPARVETSQQRSHVVVTMTDFTQTKLPPRKTGLVGPKQTASPSEVFVIY